MTADEVLGPEAYWRNALEAGRILLQRDPVDGTAFFPPRLAGPKGQKLEWIEASGQGVVYSVTVITPRPPLEPYHVALIDLAEGVRMMSRVEGVAPTELSIGDTVSARIVQGGGGPLVVFHPA